MSFSMEVTVDCVLALGKRDTDFREAMALFFEGLKIDTTSEPECMYTHADRKMRVEFCGDVSNKVRWGVVLQKSARRLGAIVAEGGYILMRDRDSGGDEPCTWFWFGPNAEAVRLTRINVALERLTDILTEMPPAAIDDMRQKLVLVVPAPIGAPR